jgi:hypothetical protein
MVDAADSKSARVHPLWEFESPLRHQSDKSFLCQWLCPAKRVFSEGVIY